MKVQKYAFYGQIKEKWVQVREVPAVMQVSMILLAVLCLATSLLVVPGLRQAILEPAAQALQQGVSGYQEAILGLLGSGH